MTKLARKCSLPRDYNISNIQRETGCVFYKVLSGFENKNISVRKTVRLLCNKCVKYCVADVSGPAAGSTVSKYTNKSKEFKQA